MDRVYSLLTIKSINEDQRIIEGIASTPSTDRMGDIVEPMGASFRLPIPLLWQHDTGQPIGEVIAAQPNEKGIPFSARVAKIGEPGVLKDRIDSAWQALKYELVRGLSIGFKPLESARIKDTWSEHYTKWEWLELSCVTLAANSEASITAIKSADQMHLHQRGLVVSEADYFAWAKGFKQRRDEPSGDDDPRFRVIIDAIHVRDQHIRALEARLPLGYGGTWKEGEPCKQGFFYSFQGSLWYCRTDSTARPGTNDDFQLAVKSGKSAR